MNFNRGRSREEPEINLIPLIDVLLVVIIFLVLTTTYSRYAGLEINLPTSQAESDSKQSNEIEVTISAAGQITVDGEGLQGTEINAGIIAESLTHAARAKSRTDPLIVISADAQAKHQNVIDVMQAAQSAGFPRISFTTQTVSRQ